MRRWLLVPQMSVCCETLGTAHYGPPVLTTCHPFTTPGKVKVNITVQDGTQFDFSTPTGITLMEAIRDIAKLDMDVSCEKKMACSICHVYVCDGWYERLPAPSEEELDTLEMALETRDNSRLSCQVQLTSKEDGIVVSLPKHTVDLTLKEPLPFS